MYNGERTQKEDDPLKRSCRISLFLILALSVCLGACGRKPAEPAPAEALAASARPVSEAASSPAPVPVPEPTDAPSPAYDAAAYEAARTALLDEYRVLCITEPGEFREAEHPEIPRYSLVTYLYNQYDGVYLYSGRFDFDGNGVPELIMAVGDEQYRQPIGIYAFDGGKLVYLCKEKALGDRASVRVSSDGDLTVTGSSGAASGGVIVYRIGSDGYSTDILDRYEYEFQPDNSVRITNHVGSMSAETFDAGSLSLPFDVPVEYELVSDPS